MVKSPASWLSWLATVALPCDCAAEAALCRLVAICFVTDAY